MRKKNYLLKAFVLSLVFTGTAFADVAVRTFESKVISVPPPSTTSTTYSYKVYGPDHTEYVLEGTPSEMSRLADTVRANPDVTVRLEGDVLDGPNRVFRLKRWESSSHSETDAWGNKTTTTTTETTETR